MLTGPDAGITVNSTNPQNNVIGFRLRLRVNMRTALTAEPAVFARRRFVRRQNVLAGDQAEGGRGQDTAGTVNRAVDLPAGFAMTVNDTVYFCGGLVSDRPAVTTSADHYSSPS
jgi:hypothetical protein